MNCFYQVNQQLNDLADGSIKQRIISFTFHAELQWGDGWIREEDLTGLINVANDASATLSFVPRPDTDASITFEVIWTNKLEFAFHRGHFGTYGGLISLVSPLSTSTITELP